MAEMQQTYLAHLATLGIDATQIVTDHKGTVASPTLGEDQPRVTMRLPRLLLGNHGEPGGADLELGDPLDKGGMGVVWSATQVALRRRVAVKRLRDERVGREAEAQLLREALVTGALEHPNIVPVHALGQDDHGRPLLVMKQIEGTPWSALAFVLTAVAIVVMPELRGLWIAIGGFGAFAAGAIVWREVEQGRHPAQRIKPVPRANTPFMGATRRK